MNSQRTKDPFDPHLVSHNQFDLKAAYSVLIRAYVRKHYSRLSEKRQPNVK